MVHLNFGAKLFSILGFFCVSIRRINEGFMVEFKVQFKKKGNDSLLCMLYPKHLNQPLKVIVLQHRSFLCDCCEAYCIPKVTTEDMCYLKMHSLLATFCTMCLSTQLNLDPYKQKYLPTVVVHFLFPRHKFRGLFCWFYIHCTFFNCVKCSAMLSRIQGQISNLIYNGLIANNSVA